MNDRNTEGFSLRSFGTGALPAVCAAGGAAGAHALGLHLAAIAGLAGAAAGLAALLGARLAARGQGVAKLARPPMEQEAARDLVRVITDAAPDAVLFFSDAGVIRYANASARELFFDGNHPEGENFIMLVARAPAPLREALLGDADRLFTVEVAGRHETFHVSRRSFPLEGDVHTVLVVKQLTREISRREVDVLKQVVRVISHEVNNSLAPISSLVHTARLIVKDATPSDKLTRVFDTIEERSRHLRDFLEGYAVMARLPQPRQRLVEWAPFLRQLGELHPDVRFPEPPDQPGWFDSVQVEQLMINLIKNAREAGSSPDQVELRLRVTSGGETELEVLDSGGGFSNEALHNALLPLYSTKERGSGMGLALSREIAEAHGGNLAIANRAERGAVVRISLPGRSLSVSPNLTRSRLTLGRKE